MQLLIARSSRFERRNASSARLRSVMSSFTARNFVIAPWAFRMAEITTDSQKSSPFFFLLWNSPLHSPPEVIVRRKLLVQFSGESPDFRMRGFFPRVSSKV